MKIDREKDITTFYNTLKYAYEAMYIRTDKQYREDLEFDDYSQWQAQTRKRRSWKM